MPLAESGLYDVRVYFHKPFYIRADNGDVVSVNHRLVFMPEWSKQEPRHLILYPVDTDGEIWIMASTIAYITIKLLELDDSGNVIDSDD